jgi:hypothetical protein
MQTRQTKIIVRAKPWNFLWVEERSSGGVEGSAASNLSCSARNMQLSDCENANSFREDADGRQLDCQLRMLKRLGGAAGRGACSSSGKGAGLWQVLGRHSRSWPAHQIPGGKKRLRGGAAGLSQKGRGLYGRCQAAHEAGIRWAGA